MTDDSPEEAMDKPFLTPLANYGADRAEAPGLRSAVAAVSLRGCGRLGRQVFASGLNPAQQNAPPSCAASERAYPENEETYGIPVTRRRLSKNQSR